MNTPTREQQIQAADSNHCPYDGATLVNITTQINVKGSTVYCCQTCSTNYATFNFMNRCLAMRTKDCYR